MWKFLGAVVELIRIRTLAELKRLLEERGWTGWTKLERVDPSRR